VSVAPPFVYARSLAWQPDAGLPQESHLAGPCLESVAG
jgi:hypothetical protein